MDDLVIKLWRQDVRAEDPQGLQMGQQSLNITELSGTELV